VKEETWYNLTDINDDPIDCRILIKEPPCSNCIHWKPHKCYTQQYGKLELVGIRCCTKGIMKNDFTCFVERRG